LLFGAYLVLVNSRRATRAGGFGLRPREGERKFKKKEGKEMEAKFYNPEIEDFETIDTDNLVNDSGENWTEKMLVNYIHDVCPAAKSIGIF
jgi:hypothetical protein